jgi:hypothetical protein
MWSHEHTVETEAPAEAIWRLWSDVSTWSSWDDDIEWARLDGQFAVGSRGKLKPKGVPAGGFKLVAVNPGVSYTVEQRLPLARLRFEHEVTEAGEGPTRFTHRVTVDGPLAALFARLFGRRMKANFPTVMRHLAEAASASAQAGDQSS